jgi:hypothetical protein
MHTFFLGVETTSALLLSIFIALGWLVIVGFSKEKRHRDKPWQRKAHTTADG